MNELTTKQVAARLKATPQSVRLWCRRGLFPNAYEVQTDRGSVWRIPEGDMDGFVRPKPTGRPRKPKEPEAKAA